MKRDMDLVRQILFVVEEKTNYDLTLEPTIEGFSRDEVSYHVLLLKEAGLIDAWSTSDAYNRKEYWRPVRLTWEGHEFLDAAREDTRWKTAKDAMNATRSFAFDVAKQILIQMSVDSVKRYLQIP